jgi:hypothetical protein
MERPKLKDNKGKKPFELYPLGQFSNDIIIQIATWLVYYFFIGKSDL